MHSAIILLYGSINFLVFIYGLYQTKKKANVFGVVRWTMIFGIFVWGDAVVIGLFWTLVSLVTLILNDWYLFLLSLSLFWLIRSLGEVMYWIGQQYSTLERNPPHKQPFFSLFKYNSIWFINQIIWQCIAVVSIIFSIYFCVSWIQTIQ